MQERTRYRITGTVFLIALAVILLPMLFDGAGVDLPGAPAMPAAETRGPPLPVYEEVVPATDVVERVTALADEVDADGFSAEGTRFGEPVLQQPDDATAVWAVQAASFADVENARLFREELRALNLESFISSRKRSGEIMHRVAVGPFLEKDDAEAVLTRIERSFDVGPVLVEMLP